MLKRYFFLAGLLAFSTLSAWAQCSFTPTVTPNNLILCPNTQDTLWTQAYDSYQWLKDGQPIDSATEQFYVVDQYRDAGSEFSVRAMVDTCQATSARVLVDGWVFAGLTVSADGDFASDPDDGHFIICQPTALLGPDTLYFQIQSPYTRNVQWFNGGTPLPDTGTVLTVTTGGTYTVIGSTQLCPNFSQGSLPMAVEFRAPAVPAVAQVGDHLEASDPNNGGLRNYQWMTNNVIIPGATGATYTPPADGWYRVQADDQFCYTFSDTVFFSTTTAVHPGLRSGVSLYPNPASGKVSLVGIDAANVVLIDAQGREVLSAKEVRSFDVSGLPQGVYSARVVDRSGMLVGVVRLVR